MNDEQHCSELLPELADFIDGEASREICAEIEKHMADCPDCRIVIDTLKKTIHLYRQRETQVTLPTNMRERLLTSLHLEEYLNDQD